MQKLLVSIHARQFHSGRQVVDEQVAIAVHVSIHARQFHSGRRPLHARCRFPLQFQSTPANFTAGDIVSRLQSDGLDHVSIHARQFHSGRQTMHGNCDLCFLFQSTPANFTAGDQTGHAHHAALRCFNPRPPISQRATSRPPVGLPRVIVSIHARQFHSGRRLGGPRARCRLQVSIHARQFHSGRPSA